MADESKDPVETGMDVEVKNDLPTNENITLAPGVMATLDRQKKSGSDNHSGSGGSGNNSDNSGLVSMGNNSFGFNFDNEDALEGSGNSSDQSESKDNGSVLCSRKNKANALPEKVPSKKLSLPLNENTKTSKEKKTDISNMKSNEDAAAAAVERLRSVVKSSSVKWDNRKGDVTPQTVGSKENASKKDATTRLATSFKIKKEVEDENDEFGYHTDDEADDKSLTAYSTRAIPQASSSKEHHPEKKKKKN